MTAPDFRFGGTGVDTSRGLVSSGEAASEFFHPVLPATMLPAAGYQVIVNGYNLNRAMPDTTGHNDTAASAMRMLQMRAPRQAIMPLVSWVGTGRIFRPGAKWRYRWYDSRTGEHSGLSPIPDTPLNMGVETPESSQTYLGQTAYFYLPTSLAPANADTLQLFANTTQQDDTWYLDDETDLAGASYVSLSSKRTDEELFSQVAVVTGTPSAIPAGPSWDEGIMWPCAKAWRHPTGRIFYFGLRRYGRFDAVAPDTTVTQGSDLIQMATSTAVSRLIEPGRTGQRVRFWSSTGTEINDPTAYRLVKAESASSFRITPELQVSTELASGASASWEFTIEDDRDARWTWMSEPNKPWLIDPLKVIAAGDDYDDGAMHWFSLPSGAIFMQTKRRIYEALGSIADDPSRSTLFSPRSEEGTPGFHSGCETPFGWVFLHETRGLRVFDGSMVRPLSGNGDPFADFSPRDQFAGFEPSMMSEVVCSYDAEFRVVLVSYVPAGQGTRKEVLAFDTATRTFRGPYRDRITAVGELRSTTTSSKFVTGDDFGNLMTREVQSLDVVPATTTGLTGTGSPTLWEDERFLTDTGNSFDGDSDSRLRGSPIWFTRSSDGAVFMARIADVPSDTQIEIDGLAVSEDGTSSLIPSNFTYSIGAIRWSLTTAYIEPPGDLAQPVEFFRLNTRFHRGSASETFEVGCAEDANGTYAGVPVSASSEAAPTRDVEDNVHGQLRLKRKGSLVKLRVRGLSRNGEPQIVGSVLETEARDGALPT